MSKSIGNATPRNPVNVDRVRDKCLEIFLLMGFFSREDALLGWKEGEREGRERERERESERRGERGNTMGRKDERRKRDVWERKREREGKRKRKGKSEERAMI